MKFSEVSSALNKKTVEQIENNFDGLMIELGVREGNEHVGSGLGGNNFQLLVLMGLPHRLANYREIQIVVSNNDITWGSDFLLQASRKKLRLKLDEMFPVIQERHKILAATMEGAMKSPLSYFNKFREHSSSFPSLSEYQRTGVYKHDDTLSYNEQLLMALVITKILADELDVGNTKNITKAGQALVQFPDEIFLMAVRHNIQIDRLVRFNLDENPIWYPALVRINKKAN
jgi:hypothetical protein